MARPGARAAHLRRQHILVLDAEHLAELERGAAHAAQRVRQPLRVGLGQVPAHARPPLPAS